MAASRVNTGLQCLRRAALARDGAGLSDSQLLECFVSRHEEAAFEAIMRRHGPMVMGVCRRLLSNRHDAEDAFQATFLVLVRKAGAIVSRELLANWLYGVAYNTALKARAITARRRARERQVAKMSEAKAAGQELWSDLQPILDAELSGLPEKYRVPIILCDLEGKTRKEAARQLGWPEGTLSGRLARGRRLLAGKLTRRGLVLSCGSLVGALASQVSARVPPALVSATLEGAAVFRTGGMVADIVSARVAALAEGVLKSMLAAKLKMATGVLCGLMIFAAGAGQVTGLYQQAGPDAATARSTENIDQLIRRLGSERYADRAAAGKALGEIGEPVLPALRRAALTGGDLEMRRRARDLIRKIESRWELLCFKGHTDSIPAAVLSPDGRLVLSAGRSESSPRLWDLNTATELRRFHGHTSWVWAVSFTPDGKRAVSAGVDGMRLWDVETGKELRRFGHPLLEGMPGRDGGGHWRQVYRVVISADGRRALSGSQDTTVRLWDLETGKELGCFRQHTDEIFAVDLSPDGRRALSTSADNTMRLWEVDTGKVLHQLPGASCAVFSPDGSQVLSGGRDEFMRLWDVTTGKELRRFRGHGATVACVAFSRNGKQALSGSADNTVRLWEVSTAKELRCFHTPGDISSVAFCPDGKRALSASYDRTMRLWLLPK